jgi:uncharacterized protein YndB with AHSA1/START domain
LTQSDTATTGYPYTISRVLDAPVGKVWTVWTEPEHYSHWFHAPLPSVSLDVREGGSWKATMVAPDGSEHALTGSYGEVVEHQRIVTTMDMPGRAEPVVMDFVFTDLGEQTKVALTQTCDSPEERDMAQGGSQMLMDSFAAYLDTV